MQPYGRSMFFTDRASAWIGLEQDGTMVIRAGVTDLGAGQAASLANIAGEILGVTVDRTSVHIGDSHLTPLTGGTFATRQLYMSGNATVKVATALRDKLAPVAADLLGCEESELEWAGNRVGVAGDRVRSVTMAELSRTAEARDIMPYSHETFTAQSGEFDAETGRGQTYPDYTHGCHAADVEVDERTGEVKILKYVAVHDVGRAIDMQRVEGQIQGAAAQGIGYAMSEEMETEGGVLHSTLFANYLIPTSLDLPDLKAIGLELYLGKGPFGARGIGEPPIGPCGPALASAIHDAIGVRMHRLPMTPERILAAMRAATGARRVSAVAANGPAVALLQPRPAGRLEVATAADPRGFHASMPGYAPTPLRAAPVTAKALGVAEVLVKDESSRLGLPSFKVLGASWAVYRALLRAVERDRRGDPDLRRAARRRGAAAAAVAERRNRWQPRPRRGPHGRAAGPGRGDLCPGQHGERPDRGHRERGRHRHRGGRGLQRRHRPLRAGRLRDLPGHLRHLVGGIRAGPGVGHRGLRDGVRRDRRGARGAPPPGHGGGADRRRRAGGRGGAPLLGPGAERPLIIGVEPTSAACVLESVAAGEIVTLDHPQDSIMAGLNCATPSLIAWPVVSRGIDAYVAVPDARVPEAMRLLAADGIVAGETGAGGLAGMLALVQDAQMEEARSALGLGACEPGAVAVHRGGHRPRGLRAADGGREEA